MKLAVFDLDHTLLAGDSDYLWGQFLVEQGHVDAAAYERENRRFYEEYQAGTLDILQFCAFSLKPLSQHPMALLQEWRRQFLREKIEPIIAAGAPALLERHRAEGATLLITSATNRFVTEPIAALLGVPHLLATDPEIRDGRYSGQVAGLPNFQGGKVTRLREWLAAQPQPYTHMIAYSDSRNDIPLLEMAQQAVAVDPDDVLRAEAQRRGWQVISLREEPASAA
ncbi:HAD family hydrolase [Solimonas sp. K1W22B-7]|uniref:histidinol-phosphatase n=1 Tax=Solimonas sp. K1W22B-7 TaxID=2303331 RepID=UPI000E3343C4|nr:HAD family hydrolase [Solimonas sp. K1W22B-7]AXQ27433.1 HAD family hydrolase [Solimonas sp. K1W22B-7]